MQVTGQVVDSLTNQGIPGASVTVTDINGNSLGNGVAANNGGHFTLPGDVAENSYLNFSSIGYTSVMTSAEDFSMSNIISLDQSSQTLAPVVITPGAKTNNNTGLALAGLGILALLTMDGKSRKKVMGAIDVKNVNWANLAIGGVVVIGGYYVGNKLGLWGASSGKAGNNATVVNSLASVQASLNSAQQAGINPTYSSAQFNGWANSIYNLGTSDTPVSDTDQYSIIWNVMQCNNIADLLSLKLAFGARSVNTSGAISLCAVLGMNCTSLDLDSFLKLAITNTSYLQELNSYLSMTNINYQF